MKGLILFDGECRLCQGIIEFVIDQDSEKNFLILPLQDKLAEPYLTWTHLPPDFRDALVLIQQGNCYTGATAVTQIAKILSNRFYKYKIFLWVPKFLGTFIYMLIARIRYKVFGKRRCKSWQDSQLSFTILTVEQRDKMLQKTTLAAGCFWGVEEKFQSIPGVIKTRVGYIGGQSKNPTYEEVCSGTTGHAEAVEITYDPILISYAQLLEIFWNTHDPTTLNQQGPDHGSQYRSAIFTHNVEQHSEAIRSKENIEHSGRFSNSIVTEIVQVGPFTEAESYHQCYIKKQKILT